MHIFRNWYSYNRLPLVARFDLGAAWERLANTARQKANRTAGPLAGNPNIYVNYIKIIRCKSWNAIREHTRGVSFVTSQYDIVTSQHPKLNTWTYARGFLCDVTIYDIVTSQHKSRVRAYSLWHHNVNPAFVFAYCIQHVPYTFSLSNGLKYMRNPCMLRMYKWFEQYQQSA